MTPIYRNDPTWAHEHIKSDVRCTTWCGLQYDIPTARQTPRTGKPLCEHCRSVENGDTEPGSPPRLFGWPR
jgi:hypothetical protein